jgi:putative transposase
MARPLRIEFPGAVYHLTSRGDRREAIFDDDDDRHSFLAVLAHALERGEARALAYCLMGNHYHLVLQTQRANLSTVMRQINGIYTQRYNRRHGKSGHVFQGRFKAILVDKESYLLEVCRYVELNPVRANLVADPLAWPWSSLAAHLGKQAAPPWLDHAAVQALLLNRPARSSADAREAARRYAALIASSRDVPLWDDALHGQIFLGDDDFAARMRAQAAAPALQAVDVPRAQRQEASALRDWLGRCATRDEAFARAHREGGMTMTTIAAEAGLSVARVSQIIQRWELAGG